MTRPDLTIRTATAEDLGRIVDIHRRARDTYYRGVLPAEVLDDPQRHAEFHDAYAHAIQAPDRTVVCADAAGRTVAFMALGPPFAPASDADPATVGQLVGLYVHPAHWGHGAGTALHAHAVQVWQSTGISTAHLEVWNGNQRARAFYDRHGWQETGHDRPGPGGSRFLELTLTVPT